MRATEERKTVRRFALSLAALLAGCATASIEDAVPAGALASREDAAGGTATPVAAAAPTPPSTPGTYPNLNIAPTPAAAQITPEEKEAETAELRARREQLAGELRQRDVSDNTSELNRLAQSHADAALKEIQGQ